MLLNTQTFVSHESFSRISSIVVENTTSTGMIILLYEKAPSSLDWVSSNSHNGAKRRKRNVIVTVEDCYYIEYGIYLPLDEEIGASPLYLQNCTAAV